MKMSISIYITNRKESKMDVSVLKKQKGSNPTYFKDIVAQERCFKLNFYNNHQEKFYCLPYDLKELSVGYLVANGMIKRADEVVFSKDVMLADDQSYSLDVNICHYFDLSKLEIVYGSAKHDLFLKDSKQINWDRAMEYEETLLNTSELFEKTGCIHAAALCKGGQLCYIGEDISRFFALYKAIGKAVLAGEDLSSFVLCTTGRLPTPYMIRVIKSNICCVISRSAPTDLSYEYANKFGVSIFGFASGKRINYYAPNVAACLLAGGKGSRAEGNDKAFFTYKGVSFLQTIFTKMGSEGENLISYNKDPETVKGNLKKLNNIKIISDLLEDIGPMGGIYTALKLCNSAAVLFAPCDLPFYSEKIAQLCKTNFKGLEDALIITYGEKLQPLCGIYSKSCITAMEQMIKNKNYRIRDLLKMLHVTYVDAQLFGIEENCFKNVNTLQEYNLL